MLAPALASLDRASASASRRTATPATGHGPPTGKRWNDTYTEEQRAAVAALPPVSATRDGSIAFGLALAELLLTRARPLFPRYDLDWPADLAVVVAERVRAQLGIDITAWCY